MVAKMNIAKTTKTAGKMLCLLTSVVWAQQASAASIVIGGGLAQDCYNAVKIGDSRIRDAIETCTTALTGETLSRKDRAATYANRGVLEMRSGHYMRALKDYERALSISESLTQAYINKGAAYIYLHEYQNALDALDVGVTATDSDDLPAAYYNRAIAHEALGDLQSAFDDFQMAVQLKPDFEQALKQLSRFEVITKTE